jgi:hypothetical protein
MAPFYGLLAKVGPYALTPNDKAHLRFRGDNSHYAAAFRRFRPSSLGSEVLPPGIASQESWMPKIFSRTTPYMRKIKQVMGAPVVPMPNGASTATGHSFEEENNNVVGHGATQNYTMGLASVGCTGVSVGTPKGFPKGYIQTKNLEYHDYEAQHAQPQRYPHYDYANGYGSPERPMLPRMEIDIQDHEMKSNHSPSPFKVPSTPFHFDIHSPASSMGSSNHSPVTSARTKFINHYKLSPKPVKSPFFIKNLHKRNKKAHIAAAAAKTLSTISKSNKFKIFTSNGRKKGKADYSHENNPKERKQWNKATNIFQTFKARSGWSPLA